MRLNIGRASARRRTWRVTLLIAVPSPAISWAKPACLDVWPGLDGGWVLRQPDDYRLTDNQVERLRDEAMRGSADAALRLGRFYVRTVDPDSREGLYWLHIAVENGSPGGMLELGQVLVESDDAREKARGVYWLRRSLQICEKPGRDIVRLKLQ